VCSVTIFRLITGIKLILKDLCIKIKLIIDWNNQANNHLGINKDIIKAVPNESYTKRVHI